MALTITAGDATRPHSTPAIIAHVCNDQGGWGAGFTGMLSRRWDLPEANYRAQVFESLPYMLGTTMIIPVEDDIQVANMIAQRGYRSPTNRVPLDYAALSRCLSHVATVARQTGSTVHMPRIGCGLGGGNWSVVRDRINIFLTSHDIDVTIYDLPAHTA